MRARPITPPITPPAIAPTFGRDFSGLLVEVVRRKDDVAVLVDDKVVGGRDDSVPPVC